MPEHPDVEIYVERLRALFVGQPLAALRIKSPFLLRSVGVSPAELVGRKLVSMERLGKRVVFGFEPDFYAVLHLMIAGRLHLKEKGARLGTKMTLAAWDFSERSVVLTEAGTKRRASLHLVSGRGALAEFDRGGLLPLQITQAQFSKRLRLENRTLKRALTDPRLFSGIGNAYSDEILHRARLSPVTRSQSLGDEALAHLFAATRSVLTEWTQRLRDEVGDGFLEKVTAFRPDMNVHGRYGKPCPDCGTPIQRIRYANNEVNYCPECQTGGRLLADRALSRLLKSDWPRTLEELEEHRDARR